MWACGTEQWTSAQTLILSFTGILLSSTVCEVRFQILAIWHWEKIKSRKSLHSRNLHFSDCIWAWSLDPACLGLSSYTSCLPFLSLYSFVVVNLLSPVWLSATPWTVAHQASLCMGFSRQEYWSGLPFPSPGDFPDTGIKPVSPALQADSLSSLQSESEAIQLRTDRRLWRKTKENSSR